ncbi:uncharacterized protein At4g18490 isoform X2 [Nicotiana tabacum]|uniref:Uncharacterized protein At4g18490 isoform X1 n=2 Tax=Nicotiana tabacum TaxID=4097 RepID=A0A1S4DGP8_TOBAC|nr:PREDICTED: uncharacterized protein At4g18490-like isoform X1 [Nicotiana tabacum]XP_016512433.1 PREDICTED: uncharacterized protein At4g18490-like isoform X1 [Nicotiana tabacum]XP_016512434.1 PREDICTED: uncharacterized protein At4g18490-like isoform X1 [Nicotiana tabacum]
MAESQKGAASTVKSKEKDSLLDLDIGDDFLKSLKSMSMGNDAMDFDFGPISKNKKKTFNFDKEDMDFNLDSDFGKISSFNIDMPDLDISSPCKKDRKSRETSKKESKGAVNKKKGDDFNFSFDFELDNFGFGSSQESREKAKNNQEKDSFSFGSSGETGEKANNQEKECSSKKSGNEGSGSHLNEDLGSLEDRTAQKHGASEAGMNLTIDSHIDIDKNHDTTKHSLPSNHTMGNNDTSKLQSVSSEVALEKAKISLQEKISTSTQEAVCQVEGTSLISRSESRSDTSSGLQQHVNSAADVTFFGVGTDVNKKVLLDSDKNYDKTVLESSSLEGVATSMNNASEKSILESDKHVLETNKDRTQTHSNSMYIANATEDKMQDVKVGNEIQSPTSELSASSLSNGIVAEDLTAEKRRDTGVIRSKFFMPSIKPAAQMQKTTSLTETKLSEFGNKRVGSITQSPSDEIISQDNKDDETGSKAGFPTDSGLLPMINPLQTGSQESHQVLGITMKDSQLDGEENIRALIGSLRPNEQKPKLGKSVPEKSKASSKDLFTFSSRISPPSKSQQTTTSTPCSIAVTRNITPIPTAKNTLNEGDKTLPIKAARRTLDTSSLKISAKLGSKPETSRTVLQKNMKSSKNVDQHGGFKAILQAKDNNCTERLKQMPANLSIKRKVPETNLDLTILLPSKRLSHSPSESRGSSEGTERIWHKQVNDHEHSGNGNKTSDYENCQISSRDVPMEMNIKELGRPFAIEDDDNIKKAEALSKDLDDMCSMLRKKQEEAKELLVRAVVNNNKLLLLNHPIYEEKIHRVQKFAAELMMRYQLAISH